MLAGAGGLTGLLYGAGCECSVPSPRCKAQMKQRRRSCQAGSAHHRSAGTAAGSGAPPVRLEETVKTLENWLESEDGGNAGGNNSDGERKQLQSWADSYTGASQVCEKLLKHLR